MLRATRLLPTLLAATVLVSGCGDPKQVTYVDPNAGEGAPTTGTSAEPFRQYGAATAERAKAIIRTRAALAAARTLTSSGTRIPPDDDAAREVVSRTIEEDLPAFEPRVHAASPAAARTLRTALEALRDRPPANSVEYTREVRRLSDSLLVHAMDVAVPAAARQDIGFRAALLYETLQQAAISYEASFEGGREEIVQPAEYRVAYGLLIDASTRQLEAVPEDERALVRSKLDKIARSSLPGPGAPEDPRDPETVLGELATLADDVAQAAAIDPTYAEPDPAVPDQLRSLKRSVAAAVEAWERGARADARRQLAAADRTHLAVSSAGLAAVSPGLLAELERDVVINLPAAMASAEDVAPVAAEVDARIDEAIQLVEEELELLRESS